jgi:hypothetical protein
LWDSPWIDDRDLETPLYPRLTRADAHQRQTIDRLLQDEGVLSFRAPATG